MRFINRDSYDLSNRYAYCNGNPTSQTDPSGHLSGWAKSLMGIGFCLAGDAAGGLVGQALVAGIEMGIFAAFDKKNLKSDGINAGIGLGVSAGLATIVRGVKNYEFGGSVGKKVVDHFLGGHISDRVLNATAEEVEDILKQNGLSFNGSRKINEFYVKRVFSTLRKNNYFVTCMHETKLWIAAKRMDSVSFDEIVNMMKSGKLSHDRMISSLLSEDVSKDWTPGNDEYYRDIMDRSFCLRFAFATHDHAFYAEKTENGILYSIWSGNSTSLQPPCCLDSFDTHTIYYTKIIPNCWS